MNSSQVRGLRRKGNNRNNNFLTKPLTVGFSWGLQTVAWGGFIFLLWVFVQLLQEDEFSVFSSIGITVMLFWIVTIFGIYKFSQRISVDHQSITVKSWLGKQKINWEEIEKIRLRKYLADIAIYGNKKKLVITSPSNWRGSDKQKLLEFLNTQIEDRNIELLDTNF